MLKELSRRTKQNVHNAIAVVRLMYGSETEQATGVSDTGSRNVGAETDCSEE